MSTPVSLPHLRLSRQRPGHPLSRHIGRRAISRCRQEGGFSLVEILVVVTIILVMVAITAVSMRGAPGAAALTGDGERISALIGAARQYAMAHGSLTALVVVTDPRTEIAYKAASIWELPAKADGSTPIASDWKQVSQWERLRSGNIFIPPQNDEMDIPASGSIPPLPTIRYGAHTIAADGFCYKLFLPSGGLRGDQAGVLTLAEGFVQPNGAIQFTNTDSNQYPLNRYKITIVAATGHVVIERP